MTQDPQKFEPLIVCCQNDAQLARGVSGNLTDQQTCRKHAAIARTYHPVPRPHLIAVLEKINDGCRRVIASHDQALSRGLDELLEEAK